MLTDLTRLERREADKMATVRRREWRDWSRRLGYIKRYKQALNDIRKSQRKRSYQILRDYSDAKRTRWRRCVGENDAIVVGCQDIWRGINRTCTSRHISIYYVNNRENDATGRDATRATQWWHDGEGEWERTLRDLTWKERCDLSRLSW